MKSTIVFMLALSLNFNSVATAQTNSATVQVSERVDGRSILVSESADGQLRVSEVKNGKLETIGSISVERGSNPELSKDGSQLVVTEKSGNKKSYSIKNSKIEMIKNSNVLPDKTLSQFVDSLKEKSVVDQRKSFVYFMASMEKQISEEDARVLHKVMYRLFSEDVSSFSQLHALISDKQHAGAVVKAVNFDNKTGFLTQFEYESEGKLVQLNRIKDKVAARKLKYVSSSKNGTGPMPKALKGTVYTILGAAGVYGATQMLEDKIEERSENYNSKVMLNSNTNPEVLGNDTEKQVAGRLGQQ